MDFTEGAGRAAGYIAHGLRLWTGSPPGLKRRALHYEGFVTRDRWLEIEFSAADSRERYRVTIDRDAKRVVRSRSSRELLGGAMPEHKALALLAASLPVALAIMPLLILKSAGHEAAERRTGLDPYCLEFFRTVRRKLPRFLRDELREALRNLCAAERAVTSSPRAV